MTGFELLLIGACCGAFCQDGAQEELAQRQLDTIKANEKHAEQKRIAEFYGPKKELSWAWPQSLTGIRAIYVALGMALIPFIIAGIQCLVIVLKN